MRKKNKVDIFIHCLVGTLVICMATIPIFHGYNIGFINFLFGIVGIDRCVKGINTLFNKNYQLLSSYILHLLKQGIGDKSKE